MNKNNIPINKGNYSMDTKERGNLFEKYNIRRMGRRIQ